MILAFNQNRFRHLKPSFFSMVSRASSSALGFRNTLYGCHICNVGTNTCFFFSFPWFRIPHRVANASQEGGHVSSFRNIIKGQGFKKIYDKLLSWHRGLSVLCVHGIVKKIENYIFSILGRCLELEVWYIDWSVNQLHPCTDSFFIYSFF